MGNKMGYIEVKPKLTTPLEKKFYKVIVELVEKYVCNFGDKDGEFITCITPKGIPEYWEEALKVIGLKRK